MLKNITLDKEIDDRRMSEDSDSDEKDHEEYEFINKCQIDFRHTYILQEIFKKRPYFDSSCETKSNFAMMEIIDDTQLNKYIGNDGSAFFFSHR